MGWNSAAQLDRGTVPHGPIRELRSHCFRVRFCPANDRSRSWTCDGEKRHDRLRATVTRSDRVGVQRDNLIAALFLTGGGETAARTGSGSGSVLRSIAAARGLVMERSGTTGVRATAHAIAPRWNSAARLDCGTVAHGAHPRDRSAHSASGTDSVLRSIAAARGLVTERGGTTGACATVHPASFATARNIPPAHDKLVRRSQS
jgi:hypothetical protein